MGAPSDWPPAFAASLPQHGENGRWLQAHTKVHLIGSRSLVSHLGFGGTEACAAAGTPGSVLSFRGGTQQEQVAHLSMEGLLDNFLTTLRALRDVLLFRRLIGTELLIGLYYLGAVIVPFAAWWLGRWVIATFRPADGTHGWDGHGAVPMTPTLRRRLWALAILLFLVMEVFWRLAFEFGIAYFQIRDALTGR